MYKIIPNKTSLLQFENETKNTLFLWKNRPAVDNIKTMAEQLDIYYGKNRDIFADMGGYIVIIYGETTEIEKEHEEILNRHFGNTPPSPLPHPAVPSADCKYIFLLILPMSCLQRH